MARKRLLRILIPTLGILTAFFLGAMWMAYRESDFDRAVWAGDIDGLRIALEDNGDVNRMIARPTLGNTLRRVLGFQRIGKNHPVVVAARNGNLDMVAELIRAGADVNGHDGTGFSALTLAALSGDAKLSELLLDHGADPNLRWKDGTPIHAEAKPHILDLFKKRGIALKP